jgi:sarcosine oxidase gamma subunit
VTTLDFLSPDLAAPEAVWRSPLERALAHAPEGIEDVSRTGVLEVRGDLTGLEAEGYEVVQLTPARGLVICEYDNAAAVRGKLRLQFPAVTDMSAAYAGLRVGGEWLLRRLTDLDPEALPAVGSLAHVRALVLRDGDDTFRILFAQEYGHYVAEVVVDAAEGSAG